MGVKVNTALEAVDNPSQCSREVFVEQLLWLIRMRWVAVVGLVGAGVVGSYVFPVLVNATPIYICAGLLLVSNIIYYLVASKNASEANPKDVLLGMIQLEADLLILTAVLHFSGGVVNPFFLFYLFHVIIATIILPRNLSFSIGVTAILLFGALAINELNGGSWLGYYPLKLSAIGGLWRNPVYGLGVFAAFSSTIVLTQYLTRIIVVRMTTKHEALEKDLRDQTEHVSAINEMLKMTRVQMAQREKMVAIGQMAAGIAHEIGNPLASLSSVAQYLGRKIKTHEEKEHLLTMEYQVKRISDILKRMLSLSRPATGKYKWTDINELIDNTLSLIKFDKRMHSITVKNVGSDNLAMVWLDPQLFEQVLLNIFINALDAMNAKEVEQEHILEITRKLEDEMIELRIKDTGIGMSRDVAKKAFESFFTTKEIGKGTGLGLFISYNLVTEIDGTIELESELDKGTTVIIRFPIRPKNRLISDDSGAEEFIKGSESVMKNSKELDDLKERFKGQ